jgi:hypothetical protein
LANQHGEADPQFNSRLIIDFVEQAAGLSLLQASRETLRIRQSSDGKSLLIPMDQIEKVLTRFDQDGERFLQVNFVNGNKILLTCKLVGFRPHRTQGLDLSQVPSVVTTPDLISVVEALEDSLQGPESDPREVESLRRLFHSVVEGAERVGFDLTDEKAWLMRLNRSGNKASA